jgi:putative membrane protein
MLRMGSKQTGLALVLGAAVAMTACKKSENAAYDSGLAKDTGMAAADTGMAAAPAPAPAPAPTLTDANIVFILDNANMLDSAAGSVAAKKGTSADVREFGKRMMRDHHSLRKQGQDLAKKLGVTPTAPANDDSKAQYDKTMSTLNGAAKGKDFDKAYIDNEVTYHQAVLQTATNAMNAAQNAELKNLIQKAAPAIQAHLDLAKSIQGKMQ